MYESITRRYHIFGYSLFYIWVYEFSAVGCTYAGGGRQSCGRSRQKENQIALK